MRKGFFTHFPTPGPRAAWLTFGVACIGCFLATTTASGQQAAAEKAPAGKPAAKPAADEPQRLALETSDGVAIAAWCYPLPEDVTSQGTVILLHDLGGSHRTVEPLALALQKAGYAVVAPDLRGHGESLLKTLPPPAADGDQAKALKKGDFEAMAASSGGRVRSQASIVGDVESVYAWIVAESQKGGLPRQPLYVVGSGLGATVAAAWVAADSLWPPIVSGPQGGQIAGLALVSPVYATRGYSLTPALGSEAVRRSLPLLIINGTADRDGVKVFDQLKRQRPKHWFDSRQPAEDRADATAKPTLYLLQSPLDSSGDQLAAHRSADPRRAATDPAALIVGFMTSTAASR